MLRKGAISVCQDTEGGFMSNLFLAGERDGGPHPVINLKNLNNLAPWNICWKKEITCAN